MKIPANQTIVYLAPIVTTQTFDRKTYDFVDTNGNGKADREVSWGPFTGHFDYTEPALSRTVQEMAAAGETVVGSDQVELEQVEAIVRNGHGASHTSAPKTFDPADFGLAQTNLDWVVDVANREFLIFEKG